jgi:hypothetical protein
MSGNHPHRNFGERASYPPKPSGMPVAPSEFPKLNNLRSAALLAAVQISEPVPLDQAREKAEQVIGVAQVFEEYLMGR